MILFSPICIEPKWAGPLSKRSVIVSILHLRYFSGGGTLKLVIAWLQPSRGWFRAMIHALRTLAPHFAELRRTVQGPGAMIGSWCGAGADARAREKMRRLVLFAALAGVLVGTGKTRTRRLYFGLLSRARADLMDVTWIFGKVSRSCRILLLVPGFSFRVLEIFCLNKVGFPLVTDDVQDRWRHPNH